MYHPIRHFTYFLSRELDFLKKEEMQKQAVEEVETAHAAEIQKLQEKVLIDMLCISSNVQSCSYSAPMGTHEQNKLCPALQGTIYLEYTVLC